MNEIIEKIYNQTLKEKIYDELLTYYSNYNIDKIKYQEIIKELIEEKYDFKITEPSEIRNLKNAYEIKYNKRPKGAKANNIDWLKLKLENINLKDINLEDIKQNTIYKPRYVSRSHFATKKNKCMARLWNDHYGGQCSRTKINDNYCNIHHKILTKYNKLQFGRIDEPRPDRDYFNNNKLNWKKLNIKII